MADEDAVVARLRADIVAAAYSPGQHLVEVEVAERYRCGRARVRAALIRLESEGLIERRAHKGAVVRLVSIAEAIEMAEARSVLETLIAARAARNVATRNATVGDATELREIMARTRMAADSGDWVRHGTLNQELHRKIHAMGRHAVAQTLSTNLRNCGLHHQFRLALLPGRRHQVLAEHAAIVDAVVDGDEEAAAGSMRSHMTSTVHALQRLGGL